MTVIHLDDNTLAGLASIAKAKGMTVEEYLAVLVAEQSEGQLPLFSSADFEQELNKLVTDGPTLPPLFSRADIYGEHD